MKSDDSAKNNKSKILAGTDLPMVRSNNDLKMVREVKLSRRDFVKYSFATAAGLYLTTLNTGCASSKSGGSQVASYPIDLSKVAPTTQQMLSFPMPGLNGVPANPATPNSGSGLSPTELCKISQYSQYGYGTYTLVQNGLSVVKRYEFMPSGYTNPNPVRLKQFANFFTMTDIHITDKEAPNTLIYLQQEDTQYGEQVSSIYSPVMLYTTHVLDAAIQTINAMHNTNPFDFGISLGDTCNCTSYNELRWYIDVIDGKVITPSSGANLGATTIDYQKPYQAAGLNKAIPWYQTIGNHDHFWIGSYPVDADPSLGIRESYISGNIWNIGDLFIPPATALQTYPCTHDIPAALKAASAKTFYMGTLDGSTPTGNIIGAGAFGTITQPTVAADPNRYSLLKSQWIEEFFNTTTSPAGHGFNLVDPSMGSGFACYSFMPNPNVPLKIIVLDDTQSENDGSHDIHGHGFLDAERWAWLQAELAAGQSNNQLMIIAAHVPIGVSNIGSETEWWEATNDPNATTSNAVTLTNLVSTLWNTPNLLMWISGHRHFNTVKGFQSPNNSSNPEQSFWQVETSSLRDFPQQFRTFEIYLNSDYSVSIVTTNVDPAVAAGTPAATARSYAIAVQQILQTPLLLNSVNYIHVPGTQNALSVDTMDPSRPQGDPQGALTYADPTILWQSVQGVPYNASYNAELFKYINPKSGMYATLQQLFPQGNAKAAKR